jgi:carbon-monoxide dehydrogenase medium subunit
MLAGGTDLIVQVRERLRDTKIFVDAKNIPDLMQLAFDANGSATVGAAVPCYQIYANETMQSQYSALVDACRIVGSTGIQGRASIGGNLCNSGPAGDTIPPLIVLGATANVAGPNGKRAVAVEDFCTGPSRNVLDENELVVSLTIPNPSSGSGSHYLRFIPRNEMDIAEVGAGASVSLDGDTITAARIAIGAVAPTPLLVEEAGSALVGQAAGEEAYKDAANAARDAATPIDDMRGTVAHRKHLAFVLTQRALRGAVNRARGMEVGNGH